jgi:transposase
MESKNIACILYNELSHLSNSKKITLITNLFKISKTTIYRWLDDYDKYKNNIFNNIHHEFDSILITKPIVCYIVSYVLNNITINLKKIKKQLNKFFPDNKLSCKHIDLIITTNNLYNDKINLRKNYKINQQIKLFIIDSVKLNNCLTANDISIMVNEKFKLSISLTSIYNIFKKNNYVYKKTVININPYSLEDQKDQLINVYNHLENNQNNVCYDINFKLDLESDNDTFIKNKIDNINKMNIQINNDIELMTNNQTNQILKSNDCELLSIDEMSIITNRASCYGWSLKNEECIINLPFLKPNVRYSLLLATSNKKIIKYKLVKGSIKINDYILFMTELHKLNSNYTYLIDNASIHKGKKAKELYKNLKLNMVFNAPYQSKFNPIEMVFSLLRKKINKKVVKSDDDIINVVDNFINEIEKETLNNIFNHSMKILKDYIKI